MTGRHPRFDIRESARTIGVVLGVGLLANLLCFTVWIRPRERAFEALDADGRPRLETLKRREAAVEAREAYLQALRDAETSLETLRSDVLATRDRRMIATQLEIARLAREFGVALERIQYENEILPAEAIERFGMVVPLEGGYANLRKFIQAVEGSDRFFVVERVALAQGEEGGSILQLNITLATYFDHPPSREAREREERRPVRRRSR